MSNSARDSSVPLAVNSIRSGGSVSSGSIAASLYGLESIRGVYHNELVRGVSNSDVVFSGEDVISSKLKKYIDSRLKRKIPLDISMYGTESFKRTVKSLCNSDTMVETYFDLKNVSPEAKKALETLRSIWDPDDLIKSMKDYKEKVETNVKMKATEDELFPDEDEGEGEENEEDATSLQTLFEYVNSPRLPIKVFFEDSSRSVWEVVVACLMNEFGPLHVGLQVGHIRLEWGSGTGGPSIVYPDTSDRIKLSLAAQLHVDSSCKEEFVGMTNSYAKYIQETLAKSEPLDKLKIDLVDGGITYVEKVSEMNRTMLKKLAALCVIYNTTKVWDYFNKRGSPERNCQGFVLEALAHIGLGLEKEGEMGNFLDRLRKDGRAKIQLKGQDIDSREDLYRIIEQGGGWNGFTACDKSYILSMLDLINTRYLMFRSLSEGIEEHKLSSAVNLFLGDFGSWKGTTDIEKKLLEIHEALEKQREARKEEEKESMSGSSKIPAVVGGASLGGLGVGASVGATGGSVLGVGVGGVGSVPAAALGGLIGGTAGSVAGGTTSTAVVASGKLDKKYLEDATKLLTELCIMEMEKWKEMEVGLDGEKMSVSWEKIWNKRRLENSAKFSCLKDLVKERKKK